MSSFILNNCETFLDTFVNTLSVNTISLIVSAHTPTRVLPKPEFVVDPEETR